MKHALLLLAVSVGTFLSAQDFRVDVGGDKGVSLAAGTQMQGVTVQQAGWLKENRDKRLLFSGKVSKEWQKRSITFTPKTDGSVAISFMSSKKDGAFIGYRNLQITGSSLKNQKLAAGSNGLPTSWGKLGKPNYRENTIFCRHNDRFHQLVPCTGGTPVTLSFETRSE